MLLGILCYLGLGVIVVGVVCSIHLYKAESQGYEAIDYWDYVFQTMDQEKMAVGLAKGFIIWPIRMTQFIAVIGEFYDIYDYRKYGPRTRRGWL